jgi:hypothetical protein
MQTYSPFPPSPPPSLAPSLPPQANTSLVAYLRSFFPHDHLHLPSPPPSCSSTNYEEKKEGKNGGPSSLPPSLPPSLATCGPHDLVVTGRAFEALHRAHEER